MVIFPNLENIVLITVVFMATVFSLIFNLARTSIESGEPGEYIYTFKHTKIILVISLILLLFSFINSFFIMVFYKMPLEKLDQTQTSIFLIFLPLLLGILSSCFGVLNYVFLPYSDESSVSNLLLFILFFAIIVYILFIEFEYLNLFFSNKALI
jgi:hypothetical protein